MQLYTTGEIASLLGCREWQVRRLYEDGTLPEPQRFAGARAIFSSSLPQIIDRLRERGWLPTPVAEEVAAP